MVRTNEARRQYYYSPDAILSRGIITACLRSTTYPLTNRTSQKINFIVCVIGDKRLLPEM